MYMDSAWNVQFRDTVSQSSMLSLVENMQACHAQRSVVLKTACSDSMPPIHLSVSSHGGSLMAGLFAYDRIHAIPNVHSHVEGMVASAATLLTVGASQRTMSKHSFMLVHQPSLYIEDTLKYNDMRDNFATMHKCMEALIDVYNATTHLSTNELETLLKGDEILSAKDCLTYGFVDAIDD